MTFKECLESLASAACIAAAWRAERAKAAAPDAEQLVLRPR